MERLGLGMIEKRENEMRNRQGQGQESDDWKTRKMRWYNRYSRAESMRGRDFEAKRRDAR